MATGNIAINGLGRIGRAALKILFDTDGLEVAAVTTSSHSAGAPLRVVFRVMLVTPASPDG